MSTLFSVGDKIECDEMTIYINNTPRLFRGIIFIQNSMRGISSKKIGIPKSSSKVEYF
ncbi:hypothetical protein acsn021_12590 [Anaerocolumna cellulosilytica]|uniref:Uncharacterized protein n=1 Tax=Anaerocolumna cellulosilytica TaxID=433286 RepID=A0A6S6R2Z4_9FIRM|nr:hypothetical protein acsn021_12590 [Anaerocolumna cellulosilytica]